MVYRAPGCYMAPHVDRVGPKTYSLAHFCQQNGDLVCDPDGVFVLTPNGWLPVALQLCTGPYIRALKLGDDEQMSYIEGHQVVQRLNEALGGDWSFKVLEQQVLEAEVVVLGELRAGDVVKQAFGGSEVTRSREGKVVSVADDLKAAATDSLKKAATLLGVGLRLHGAEEVVPAPKPKGPKLVPREVVVEQQAEGAAAPTQGPQAPEGNRLTKRQAGFIEKLAKANGMTDAELEVFALEKCGRPCAQLTVQQASELIRVLGRAA